MSPCRSLEHSLTPDIRKHKHDDSCRDAHGKGAGRPCIDMTLNEMQPAPSGGCCGALPLFAQQLLPIPQACVD